MFTKTNLFVFVIALTGLMITAMPMVSDSVAKRDNDYLNPHLLYDRSLKVTAGKRCAAPCAQIRDEIPAPVEDVVEYDENGKRCDGPCGQLKRAIFEGAKEGQAEHVENGKMPWAL
ncbi:hypothetical protein P7C73_g2260, partial [Tremellales sp. Uapishka_1]